LRTWSDRLLKRSMKAISLQRHKSTEPSYHEVLELSARVTSANNWLWLCNNCGDMTRLLKNTPTPSPLTSVKLSRA